ncbi:hypothetical protein Q0M94_04520 [Deinococcus radiomollis]|uniref:hypothetical protein n=1 Tax=Deinococcus radiomollis TaxID=468916 RepID=UPI003892C745
MTRTLPTLAAALSLSVLCLGTTLAANPPVGTPAKPPMVQQPGATAPSAVITTVTPEFMLALVQAAGYTAKLDKSGDNPELTISRKNAVDIYLNFHNCKTGSCTEMDAYTYYSAGDLTPAPAESDMTAWNSKHYSQAYIDAGDADSVNLDSLYRFTGGFTRANFLNWLNEFRKDADSFDKMLKAL